MVLLVLQLKCDTIIFVFLVGRWTIWLPFLGEKVSMGPLGYGNLQTFFCIASLIDWSCLQIFFINEFEIHSTHMIQCSLKSKLTNWIQKKQTKIIQDVMSILCNYKNIILEITIFTSLVCFHLCTTLNTCGYIYK